MAVPTSANYVFLPWARQGAAAGIQTVDKLSAAQAGVVSVAVTVRVNNADAATRQVRLYGPGDVVGIDPQQIVRAEPREPRRISSRTTFPSSNSIGQTSLALHAREVRRHRPATSVGLPGRRSKAGRCDVEGERRFAVACRCSRSVHRASPASSCPTLSNSWAWGHTQVTGSATRCRIADGRCSAAIPR